MVCAPSPSPLFRQYARVLIMVLVAVLHAQNGSAECIYSPRSCTRPDAMAPVACVCSVACGSGGTQLQYRYLTRQAAPDTACLLVQMVRVPCSAVPPACPTMAPTSSSSTGLPASPRPTMQGLVSNKDQDDSAMVVIIGLLVLWNCLALP